MPFTFKLSQRLARMRWAAIRLSTAPFRRVRETGCECFRSRPTQYEGREGSCLTRAVTPVHSQSKHFTAPSFARRQVRGAGFFLTLTVAGAQHYDVQAKAIVPTGVNERPMDGPLDG